MACPVGDRRNHRGFYWLFGKRGDGNLMARFEHCLAIVLTHEGGWADHPRDPGGATMKGVTIGTFAQYKGRRVTKDELRAISDNDLQAIYRRKYWDKVQGDDLPPGVDLVAFDAAVNSGPAQSARWLQRAVGVDDDGKIGPVTIAAVLAVDPLAVINSACDQRMAMLRRLKTWPDFGRGWTRRVDDIRAAASRDAESPWRVIATMPPATSPRPVPRPALSTSPVDDSQPSIGYNQGQAPSPVPRSGILWAIARLFGKG